MARAARAASVSRAPALVDAGDDEPARARYARHVLAAALHDSPEGAPARRVGRAFDAAFRGASNADFFRFLDVAACSAGGAERAAAWRAAADADAVLALLRRWPIEARAARNTRGDAPFALPGIARPGYRGCGRAISGSARRAPLPQGLGLPPPRPPAPQKPPYLASRVSCPTCGSQNVEARARKHAPQAGALLRLRGRTRPRATEWRVYRQTQATSSAAGIRADEGFRLEYRCLAGAACRRFYGS